VVMLHNGQIIFSGAVDELFNSENHVVHQFVSVDTEGPIQPKPVLY
jgi:ABC-type transporter Mla maintaining outer membrane lipid asymmetry ATPase subunit MlaF